MRKLRITFVLTTLSILLLMNAMFYSSTRKTLEDKEKQAVQMMLNNVEDSINTTRSAENHFHEFLAQELQKSSIAIKYALPQNIENVSNQQLVQLSNELGLEGISLFARDGDDIVALKSSMPEEVGLSTRDWDKWYERFDRLFKKQNFTDNPDFEEESANFWSGPIYSSVANPELVTKWGYFYDGSTDFIVCPFIDEDLITSFYKSVGVDSSIKEQLAQQSTLLEIAIINMDASKKVSKKPSLYYDSQKQLIKETGTVSIDDKIIRYGTDKYHYKDDEKYAEEAVKGGERVQKIVTLDGKTVIRNYSSFTSKLPSMKDREFVVVVTSDYDVMFNKLHSKLRGVFFVSTFMVFIGVIFVYYVVILVNKKERTIYNIQEMYEKNNETFFKSLREYRHDLKHHLHAISGFVQMEMFDELKDYIDRIGEQAKIDEISDINMPVMIGLIRTKVAEAKSKQIDFDYHFEGFDNVELEIGKVTDLVRIIGNILDNAFHIVEETCDKNGKVVFQGRIKNDSMIFSILNNGEPIRDSEMDKIFTHGYTTRKNRGGNGFGLSSSLKILNRYKGDIQVTSDASYTCFDVTMPISTKEIKHQ